MSDIFNFFFSPERPLRTTESNVRSSGGSRSVPTGTQAFSGKSRTVSADARVPCESAKCSSETDRGSADPPKTASKGSAALSKSAPKGSAGPLKTAASNDDSSSSRCSHSKVRVDGVLVDVEGFSHPRRSAPSSRPQVPPKLTIWFSFERRRNISRSSSAHIVNMRLPLYLPVCSCSK